MGTIGAADQVIGAASAGTRSFYQSSATAMGSMKGKSTAATTSTGAAGAVYCICKPANIADPTKCNGGVKGFKISSNALVANTAATANRVASFIGIASGTNGSATYLWTWNNDVLLASVGQVAWTGTAVEDGTKWCSDFN